VYNIVVALYIVVKGDVMLCQFCGSENTKVIETRTIEGQNTIKRRRECLVCKKRFNTAESYEKITIYVIKKDGSRQLFDRGKLIRGIDKACEKRPVSRESIEKAVYDIERSLQDSMVNEIPAKELGDKVMSALRSLDEVAYVRFASVYKEFRDLGSFLEEIEHVVAFTKTNNDQQVLFQEENGNKIKIKR